MPRLDQIQGAGWGQAGPWGPNGQGVAGYNSGYPSQAGSPPSPAWGNWNTSDPAGSVQNLGGGLANALSPILKSQAGFAGRIEPFRQQSLFNIARSATPGGQEEQASAMRRKLLAQALMNLPALRSQLSLGGAGIGAQQGAAASALGGATTQANEFSAYLASPEGQQHIASVMQSLGKDSIPAIDYLPKIASTVYGRPQDPPGSSGFSDILGIASTLGSLGAFGGGAAGIFPFGI